MFGLSVDVLKYGAGHEARFGYRFDERNSQYNDDPGIDFTKEIDANGEWVNYTLTYDGQSICLYVNGDNVDKTDYNKIDSNLWWFPEKVSSLILLFSDMKNRERGEYYHTFMDGIISNIIMWDRALSSYEVLWLYHRLPELKSIVPSGFTSNTSMNGYVIDQNSYSYTNHPNAYQVFNCNETTNDYGYCSGDNDNISTDNPVWFSITIPSAVIPYAIYYKNEINSPECFKNAIFQAKNSQNENWDNLLNIENNPNLKSHAAILLVNNENKKSYDQFRMLFTSAYNRAVSLQSFKIYSEEQIYNNNLNSLF